MAHSTQVRQSSAGLFTERAGYFPVSGAHLYTVLHEVQHPIARVLLIGPSAAERHLSYRPWVQWARFLAGKGIEVLRYDYRGVGESTGAFEEMTFDCWMDDVACLSAWLRERGDGVPLVLHGLELGGILAARSFDKGAGDALMLWSAAVNANKALRAALQRWIGPQQLLKPIEQRRTPAYYFRLLDEGTSVEVEGYDWSPALWRQSFEFDLPAAMTSEKEATDFYRKPVRIVSLEKNAAPLVKGAVPGYDENKDFEWLFTVNYEWIASSLGLPMEAS